MTATVTVMPHVLREEVERLSAELAAMTEERDFRVAELAAVRKELGANQVRASRLAEKVHNAREAARLFRQAVTHYANAIERGTDLSLVAVCMNKAEELMQLPSPSPKAKRDQAMDAANASLVELFPSPKKGA